MSVSGKPPSSQSQWSTIRTTPCAQEHNNAVGAPFPPLLSLILYTLEPFGPRKGQRGCALAQQARCTRPPPTAPILICHPHRSSTFAQPHFLRSRRTSSTRPERESWYTLSYLPWNRAILIIKRRYFCVPSKFQIVLPSATVPRAAACSP